MDIDVAEVGSHREWDAGRLLLHCGGGIWAHVYLGPFAAGEAAQLMVEKRGNIKETLLEGPDKIAEDWLVPVKPYFS